MDLRLGLQFNRIDQYACIYANIMWFYYYSSIAHVKIRDSETSSSSSVIQNCFRYPGFLCVFLHEVENYPLKICKELHWNFDGIALNL